jgi:hypothetical protein
VEDPHFKNAVPPPGNTDTRFTPMALNLYYVLSAHADKGDQDNGNATLREQLLMGLAVKAMRDVNTIDAATQVNLTTILDPAIVAEGNRIRIHLQPVTPSEAVTYWTAGSSSLRLSAYYQVGVLMLEPDTAPFRSGRVLRYGVQVFTGGGPRIDATQSRVSFTAPGETTPRSVTAQPAQVPVGGELDLIGSGISGATATLSVRGPGWPSAVPVDATWGFVAASTGPFATVAPSAGGQAILPGIYSATVQTTRTLSLPDGSSRDVVETSNAAPFVVVPGVSPPPVPDSTGTLLVTGSGFAPADAVDVFVGAAKLAPAANPPTLAPGEFIVASSTQLQVRLPSGLASASTPPLRVIVSGAESTPQWVTVP